MSAITELLLSQLGSGGLGQMARSLGTSPAVTERAVEAALPALVAGLARNASRPDGASALASALDRDHDGSMLENLGPLLGALGGGGKRPSGLGGLLGAATSMLGSRRRPEPPASRAANGAGILGHIFGGGQSGVEQAVGKASGLDAAKVAQLLAMLAPMVMGALGKVKTQRGLDASGVAELLGQERNHMESQVGGFGALAGLLDADGDGDVSDELMQLGSGLLKGFQARR